MSDDVVDIEANVLLTLCEFVVEHGKGTDPIVSYALGLADRVHNVQQAEQHLRGAKHALAQEELAFS